MKLTDEERAIVVNLQMEKAHRFLEQADARPASLQKKAAYEAAFGG